MKEKEKLNITGQENILETVPESNEIVDTADSENSTEEWVPMTAEAATANMAIQTTAASVCCVTKLTISHTCVSLKVSDSYKLTATAEPLSAANRTVTWSSSKPSVATVNSSGQVCALSAGTAVITVKTNDGSNLSKTCDVTVTAKAIAVTGIDMPKTSLSLTANGTGQLTACVVPPNADNRGITWSSCDTGIATVNSNGVVTAKSGGTVNIAAKTNEGGYMKTCSVTVTVPVQCVSVSPASLSLGVNESYPLKATVVPSKATNGTVTWSSSDEKVATVNSSGLICTKNAGTATITAKAGGCSGTCKVTVTKAAPTNISEVTISYSAASGNSGTSTSTNNGVNEADAIELVEGKTVYGLIPGKPFSDVEGREHVWFKFKPTKKAYQINLKTDIYHSIACEVYDSDGKFIASKDSGNTQNSISLAFKAEAGKTYYINTRVTTRSDKLTVFASLVCTDNTETSVNLTSIGPDGQTLSKAEAVTVSTTPTVNAQWTASPNNIVSLSLNTGSNVKLTTNGNNSGIVTITATANGISKSCKVLALKNPEKENQKGTVGQGVNIRSTPSTDASVEMKTTASTTTVDVKGSIVNGSGETWYYILIGSIKGYVRSDVIILLPDEGTEQSKEYVSLEEMKKLGWDKIHCGFKVVGTGADSPPNDMTSAIERKHRDINQNDINKINELFEKYKINTKERICAFFGQCSIETGDGRGFLESAGTSTYPLEGVVNRTNLNNWFDKYRAYGSKYRGGGVIHLTGEYNYGEFSKWMTKEFKADPDILNKGAEYVAMNYPWEAGVFFWSGLHDLNRVADNGNPDEITAVVNKNTDASGYKARRDKYNYWKNNYIFPV